MKKLLYCLMFVAGTSYSCPKPSLLEAAVFDTATTTVGLTSFSNTVEMSPLGAIGSTLARFLIVANQDLLTKDTKESITAVWIGAGMHNLVHMLGVGLVPSIIIGITSGLIVKFSDDCPAEDNMSNKTGDD